MKFKNTLILLILAAGLFCFIQFYESKHDSTQVGLLKDKYVAMFNLNTIDGMTIINNEDKIDVRLQDAKWQLTSPVKDSADITLVNQILSELQYMEVINSFEADGKTAGTPTLKELGLETPAVRVKLSGSDAPPDFLFGKDTAVEGRMYVRLDGSNRVCVVNNLLKGMLQKKADDFRDRRLMDFSPGAVSRLDVKSPAGEIEVVQDRGSWFVDKPLKARGDTQAITQLIMQTVNAHIEAFLPGNGANLASYGLAEPRGSITLAVEGSDTPVVLEIGQPVENDKKKVYAKLSTRESIFILPESINDALFIKPNDVRDKHVLELNPDMVDRIHIEAANKPKLTIARKGESWTLKTDGDVAANDELVRTFVNYLRSMKISGFVSDVASDLPKYGLDKPQLRITFSAYASQNTAESVAGEDTILSLAFGKVDGDVIYVRLENEPYVVSVPKLLPGSQVSMFDAISADPVYWENLSIFNYKPEEIVSLEITRDGQTTALEHGPGGAWKLKNGTGSLNQISVQSLLNTLASLHAVRSTTTSTAGLGFEKPTMVISFTTSGNKSGKLTIGSQNEEAMWNAEAEGRGGAVILSNPDFEALHADLTGAAAPVVSPAPAESSSGAPGGVQ